MKVIAIIASGALVISSLMFSGCKAEEKQATVQQSSQLPTVSIPVAPMAANTGGELFKQYCSACHPDGGNIINPRNCS